MCQHVLGAVSKKIQGITIHACYDLMHHAHMAWR